MPDFSCTDCPPSDPESLEAAIEAVKAIFRESGKTQAPGDQLARAVGDRARDYFAADRAIRTLIIEGRLRWSARPCYGPSAFDEDGKPIGISSRSEATIPESGKVPLDSIVVQAADTLWHDDCGRAGRSVALPDPPTADSDEAMLPHRWFADKYGTTTDAARKRLDRWRRVNSEGWVEVSDRRGNEPSYLYQLAAVRHLFEPRT